MRPSSIFALSFLAVGALLPVACTQDFGVFGQTTTSNTGGSTTTSPPSSATTGTGGTGGTGGMPCTSDISCDDMNDCTVDTCNMATGACSNTQVADGPPPGF